MFQSWRKLSRFQMRSIWLVKSLVVQNAVTNSTASALRYATPSQSIGGESSSPSRSRGWRCRTPLLVGGTPCTGAWVVVRWLALDLGPGLLPLRVRRALDVRAPVQAGRRRRVPVVDLGRVRRVAGVVGGAEALGGEGTGLRVRG